MFHGTDWLSALLQRGALVMDAGLLRAGTAAAPGRALIGTWHRAARRVGVGGAPAWMNHARISCSAGRRTQNVGHLLAMVCLGPPELECVNNTTTFAYLAPQAARLFILRSIFNISLRRVSSLRCTHLVINLADFRFNHIETLRAVTFTETLTKQY